MKTLFVFDNTIQQSDDGSVFINGNKTQFKSLSEAKHQLYIVQEVEQVVTNFKSVVNLSDNKIARIIKEHHNIKVTNAIIDEYSAIASAKAFSIDPVVLRLREQTENPFLNKIDFILEDNSRIAIDIETLDKINNINNKELVLEFMSKSSNNFLKVLDVIIKG